MGWIDLIYDLRYAWFRFKARVWGQAHIRDGWYLGHCSEHDYYFDRLHTGEVIRCPICDDIFVEEFNKINKLLV